MNPGCRAPEAIAVKLVTDHHVGGGAGGDGVVAARVGRGGVLGDDPEVVSPGRLHAEQQRAMTRGREIDGRDPTVGRVEAELDRGLDERRRRSPTRSRCRSCRGVRVDVARPLNVDGEARGAGRAAARGARGARSRRARRRAAPSARPRPAPRRAPAAPPPAAPAEPPPLPDPHAQRPSSRPTATGISRRRRFMRPSRTGRVPDRSGVGRGPLEVDEGLGGFGRRGASRSRNRRSDGLYNHRWNGRGDGGVRDDAPASIAPDDAVVVIDGATPGPNRGCDHTARHVAVRRDQVGGERVPPVRGQAEHRHPRPVAGFRAGRTQRRVAPRINRRTGRPAPASGPAGSASLPCWRLATPTNSSRRASQSAWRPLVHDLDVRVVLQQQRGDQERRGRRRTPLLRLPRFAVKPRVRTRGQRAYQQHGRNNRPCSPSRHRCDHSAPPRDVSAPNATFPLRS